MSTSHSAPVRLASLIFLKCGKGPQLGHLYLAVSPHRLIFFQDKLHSSSLSSSTLCVNVTFRESFPENQHLHASTNLFPDEEVLSSTESITIRNAKQTLLYLLAGFFSKVESNLPEDCDCFVAVL